jgi:outer membrane lipoprotein SlyB
MSVRSLVIPFAAVAFLAGCVTVPVGPAVTVLPGSQKTFDQFQADEAGCRQYAAAVLGGPNAAQPANDAAAANAVAGAALGAVAGAIIGSVTGHAGNGAAIGAGTGLLFGSAAGSNAAGYSSYTLQRNYDAVYLQCMYARGNQVPGQVAYRVAPPPRTPVYSYPPANYPPANYPPANYPPPNYYPPPNVAPGNYPPPNTPPPVYRAPGG